MAIRKKLLRDVVLDNKIKLDGPNVRLPSLAFGASLQVLLPFRGYNDLVALPLGCACLMVPLRLENCGGCVVEVISLLPNQLPCAPNIFCS